MTIIILFVIYLFIIISELIPLIKDKKKKESWVYSISLSISFIILILFSFGLNIPSPINLIKNVIKFFS